MNVKTFCPHCNQPIEYDGEYAGVNVDCPNCSGQVYLPKIESPKSPPPIIQNPSVVNQPKQQSVGWGVFKGLFGFFVVLPIVLIFGVIILGVIISGCNEGMKKAEKIRLQQLSGANLNQIQKTNSPIIVPVDYGDWKIEYETDPITDIKGVVISLKPIDTSEYSFTYDTLILRYKNHKWDGYVAGMKIYGSENDYRKETTSVIYRIDESTPVEAEWIPGEDHNAMFIPNIEDFIKSKLLNHNLLVIRYSSGGRSETTSFNISYLKNVLVKVGKNIQ